MSARLWYAEYQEEKIQLSPLLLDEEGACPKHSVLLNPTDYEFFIFSPNSKSRSAKFTRGKYILKGIALNKMNLDTIAAGRYLTAEYPGRPINSRVIVLRSGENFIFILLKYGLKTLFDEISVTSRLIFPFQCFSAFASTSPRLISYFYFDDWLHGSYWENGFLRDLETIEVQDKLLESLLHLDSCLGSEDERTMRVLCSPIPSASTSDICNKRDIELLPLCDLINKRQKPMQASRKKNISVPSYSQNLSRSPFLALKLSSLLRPVFIALLLLLLTTTLTLVLKERTRRLNLQRTYQLLEQRFFSLKKSSKSDDDISAPYYRNDLKGSSCKIADLFLLTKVLADSSLKPAMEALTLQGRNFSLKLICKEPWKLKEEFAAAGMKKLRIYGDRHLELSGQLADGKACE